MTCTARRLAFTAVPVAVVAAVLLAADVVTAVLLLGVGLFVGGAAALVYVASTFRRDN